MGDEAGKEARAGPHSALQALLQLALGFIPEQWENTAGLKQGICMARTPSAVTE